MPSRMRLAATCLTLVIIGSSLRAQESAFCDAVSNGELETARTLLENGDATSADPCGQRPPLARALFANENSLPLVELLLRHGADPNRRGEAGISPFVLWTGFRDPEAPAKLELLLQHGAEVDSMGNGVTALINAARFCNTEVLSLLLKHGANPNVQPRGHVNKTSWAALHYVAGGPAVKATAEDALESARLLIAGGARVRRADVWGVTPLMLAAAGGNIQMVKLFLDHGASPKREASDGSSARKIARRLGHVEVARLLKQASRGSLTELE